MKSNSLKKIFFICISLLGLFYNSNSKLYCNYFNGTEWVSCSTPPQKKEEEGGGGGPSPEEIKKMEQDQAVEDINKTKPVTQTIINANDAMVDSVTVTDDTTNLGDDPNPAKQTKDSETNSITSEENNNNEKNKKEENTVNSETDGDPVRITEGVYEQVENDLLVSGLQSFSVKRVYQSDNKIKSSFGYGWLTNLDERIVMGVDAKADYHLQILENYSNKLNSIKNSYYNSLLSAYGVTSLDSVPANISSKKRAIEQLKLSYLLVDSIIYEMDVMITDNDISDRVSISEIKQSAAKSKTKRDNKLNNLDSNLSQYYRDVQKYQDYVSKYNASVTELNQYKQRLQTTNARKARNAKALFSGMDTFYSETGNGTITLIDENGYPCLMNEYSAGEWRPAVNSKYVKCESISNGYKLTENNGVIKYFDYYGFITKIENRNGNYIQINRDANEHITTIQTSEGESFQFTYSNGFITKITNLRDIFQTVEYGYTGNYLTSVKDTEKDTVTMSYNSDGRMVSLNKCDGSSVKFEYGEYTSDGKYLTTCTINEEGKAEHFEYDRTNRKTTYKDHDGNVTVYYYDTKHRTTKEIKSDGTVIENFYDDGKNLTRVIEDGNLTTYSYDSKGNKTKAVYSDNSTEQYSYDSHNLITLFIDRDGVRYDYVRDGNGNLTEYKVGNKSVYTQVFDSKGRVTKRVENGDVSIVTEYTYDQYGNVTKAKTDENITAYEYDGRNRVTKISQNGKLISSYVYTDKTTKRNDYNGLETVWEKNGRKDLVCVKQTDKNSGRVVISRVEYDKRHLPVKVFEGNGNTEILKNGYVYTAEGKIKAQIAYAGTDCSNYIRVYSYRNGKIESVKQFMVKGELSKNPAEIDVDYLLGVSGASVYVQKYDYSKLGQNKEKLTVTDGNGNTNLFEYDSYGNLVKITDGNGEVSSRSYTKAGRLAREQSSHGGWFNYGYGTGGELVRAGEEGGTDVTVVYNPNGSVSTKTDRYGKSVLYSYDSCGRVSSVRSENVTTWYTYDSFGRVIKAVTGASPYEQNCSYYVTYEYSDDGRSVIQTEGGKYKTTMKLDAFGNVICQIDGVGNEVKYEYDEQNRVMSSFDGYGNKTCYEYGANGGVTKVTGADGNATVYEYNYMGKLAKVTDGEGCVYSASYDAGGRLVKEKRRADAEKSYEYDKAGRVTKVLCGGETVESYTYGAKGRTITVKDGNGSDYVYNYDSFGRLTDERNRLGDVKQYFYDEEGAVKSQKSLDGGTTVIEYSGNRLTKTVRYADGSENVFEYDALGNITRAKNDYGVTEYKYDLGGMLIWQKDVTTGEEVWFEYDAAGNRTKLLSTNRETVYTYGKNNEVLEVYDNKQRMSVSLKYDVCGREVQRKFANGVVQTTSYDKAGRTVLITQKSGAGEVTWAEGYVYGEDGKRTATVDNAGRVTMYEYNQKGQLSKVYYPYTESMKQKLSAEAVEYGLPTVADVGVNKFLSSEMYTKLGALMNKMSLSWAGKVTNVQIFITEQFVYDRNGNRIQKITPFGTINYLYDVENRMISSGSNGKTVVNYTYDKNGNLLSKESALKSEKYSYNSQNRLCESVVIDRQYKTQSVSYYGYDAFGRRVVVQDRDSACMRSLYDGFTFDVIKQSPTLANGMFVDSNEIGIRLNRTGKATGDRYRYLDDDKNDGNRYFYLDEGTYKSVSSRYVGERTSITVNGIVAAQNAGGEVSYFTTDLLGSVRTTTDNAGFGTNSYTYNAFGSLVEGDLSGATDYGYLGKQFDPSTGLYNYGYRDYAPVVARFTTVDPICDGSNWFSYVNNDPVNFVDLWGLEYQDRYGAVRSNSDNMYKLDAAMNNHSQDKYISPKMAGPGKPTYQCDDYVQTVLIESGIDSKQYLAGDSQSKDVSDHIKKATENGNDKNEKQSSPELNKDSAYIVFMSDSPEGLLNHTGIIRKDENGIIHYTDNSSGNSTKGVKSREFNNESEFQDWYDYNSFYYEQVKTK